MKKTFTLIGWLFALAAQGQTAGSYSFQYDQRPPVTINGRTLLNPWVGGLNAVQYATVRLNDDARDDLVVFDRTSDKISTFLAVDNPAGGIRWQYAPEYETAFPTVRSWMALVDYDGDGRNDLFTTGLNGVRVLRNESQNGRISFRTVVDPLLTFGLSQTTIPLFVTGADIPAITDYDDDGDIDIITFDGGGDLIAYQQNMSVERTGKKDGLDFKRMGGSCWGHFSKQFCNDFVFGVQCDDGAGRIGVGPDETVPAPPVLNRSPTNAVSRKNAIAKPLHTGNTLTVLDADGDGRKDLLFGFVTCENIALLRNSGPNSDKANFTSFDSLFPAQNPILFPAFGATFVLDADGDGRKDLLASPNVGSNENRAFDFQASGWFYKNVGTTQKPDFQLVQKDFLQNEMLDLGENAAPALADLDGDGDVDMLVGYDGTGLGKDYRAGLWQFENTGTTQNPAFSLVTTDYLSAAQALNLTNLLPSFADVDGNGSPDLVLTGTGANAVEIRVLFNAAPRNAPARYTLAGATRWPVPDLMGPGDLPTLADVDQDGKPDLLIGSNDGTILYYRNAGTATAPTLQLQNQTFGGIKDNVLSYTGARSVVVADLNGDRKNELISADNNGKIRVYQFPERPDQPAPLVDSLPALAMPGTNLIAAVADLDGDQLPDLMLGSKTGGLRYLKNTSTKVIVTGIIEEPVSPWAFPNPADRYLTVRPPHDGLLELVSLTGQVVRPGQVVRASVEVIIDLGSLPAGTYLLRLADDRDAAPQNAGRVRVQKILIGR